MSIWRPHNSTQSHLTWKDALSLGQWTLSLHVQLVCYLPAPSQFYTVQSASVQSTSTGHTLSTTGRHGGGQEKLPACHELAVVCCLLWTVPGSASRWASVRPSYLVGVAELMLNCFLIVSFVGCIYSLSSVGKLYKDHILILFSKEFTWHFGELGIFPVRAHVMSKFCMLTSLRTKALRKINHMGRESF